MKENAQHLLPDEWSERQLPEQNKEQENLTAAKGQSIQDKLDAWIKQEPEN